MIIRGADGFEGEVTIGIPEVAKILGKSTYTIGRYIRMGILPQPFQVACQYRWLPSDIYNWLESTRGVKPSRSSLSKKG